jgi:hypothetical protein
MYRSNSSVIRDDGTLPAAHTTMKDDATTIVLMPAHTTMKDDATTIVLMPIGNGAHDDYDYIH